MHRSLRAAGAMIGCPWLGVAVLVSLSLFGGGCAHQTPALDVPAGAIGVMRADGSITLDGKLDEPAWRRAPASEAFVAPINRGETALADDPAYRTTVRVLHDGSTLYVAFECEGPPFWADRTKHDDHLYQQDVVEIFLDVKGDMREYIELHTSPIGTKGDAYHRWSQPPTYPADQLDWAQVRAHAKLDPEWALEGFEAGTRALEDGRQGFVVEAAVPLAGLLEGRGLPPALQRGQVLRGNFIRYVWTEDGKGGRVHNQMTWKPTIAGCPHVSPMANGVLLVAE